MIELRHLPSRRRDIDVAAIDPGPEHSAVVAIARNGTILTAVKRPNADVRNWCEDSAEHRLAIEMIASYGMPVGADVFQTCVWIGRFSQAFDHEGLVTYVTRIEVKSHLCHSGKAKDANVRQAILDRYGGKDRAIGRKASPGPLYGVTGDCWQALAVALVVQDRISGRAAA